MKKLAFVFITLLCSSFNTTDQMLTNAERDFGVKHLTETRTYLLNAIKGLSDAQLRFKTSPERWSILECMEHIVNSELLISQGALGAVSQPTTPEKRSEIKYTDEQLISAILDRTGKAKAPEMLQPTGKYPNAQAILEALNAQRDKNIEYLKTTTDDLRNHLFPHPFFGMLDSYQWYLLVGAHQKRHTLQIEEVKADPNFPKK